MSQYYRLFNTTRLPVVGLDQLATYDATCGHVLVLRNGHMYTLQAVQEDGKFSLNPHKLISLIFCASTSGQPVPCETIYHQLQGILADETPPPSHPLGYLTALNRDKWARLREEVELHNKDELSAIDSALLVLCLDDSEPVTADTLCHTMLHNYGANRYVCM